MRTITCLATLTLLLAWALPARAATGPPLPQRGRGAGGEGALIARAGNADDEGERYRLLKQLEALPDLDPALKADLSKLLPVVDDWANGKQKVVVDATRAAENGFLCRFFSGKARPAGQGTLFPPEIAAESPLYPIWCWYRGRMLIWQVIQSGPIIGVPERREAYYGEALKLLAVARRAFPENRVLGMYLGEAIAWPKTYAPLAGAPEWANLQREGLEKLADVIHWWADERQLADGQFGGGWGDDVEMWRWWTPVLIAFEDPKATAAQERISNGIFQQPHLKAGFTSRITDVEHSNEDTTDTILPMMHLKPEDPVWQKRALLLGDLMRDRWTGRNQRGFLQFRSIYFSVEKVDEGVERAFDTVYHPCVIQPTLLYWQRSGDKRLGELIGEWLKVWVDATARAESGKPAGVIPSVIQWPSGTIGKPGRDWWEPFPRSINDQLYNWPGATQLMTNTLLLARHMTGDDRYLEPIRSMAALRARYLNPPAGAEPEPGSEAWCARQMRGFLSATLSKYRFLTGDKQFDPLLQADASGYVRYRMGGDLAGLERDLLRNAQAFRQNWEGYTSEMRWTDRVMNFTSHYLSYHPGAAGASPERPRPEILYATATGDPGTPLLFPMNAVRWLTPPREIAALVTESGPSGFAAQLFHFGAQARQMGAELYLLKPGAYDLTLAPEKDGRPLARQTVRVTGPRTRVRFDLPAQRLCVLSVRGAQR